MSKNINTVCLRIRLLFTSLRVHYASKTLDACQYYSEITLCIYMSIFNVFFFIEKQDSHNCPPETKRMRGCEEVTALQGLWQYEQAKGWQGICKEERLR